MKSSLRFVDNAGIIRFCGRSKNSNFPYDIKHYIVSPAKLSFTRLVVDYEHKRSLHSWVQGTLSPIRQRYWPPNAKEEVKSYIHKRMVCFHTNPVNTLIPKMEELTRLRVTPSRPFASVAIDYTEPYDLKDGSNRIIKEYICIYI